MKKISLLVLAIMLTASLFVCCGYGEEFDYKVVLGDNYGGLEDFYAVAKEKHGELDVLHVQYADGIVLFVTRNYINGSVEISTYNVHTGERSKKISSEVASAVSYQCGFLQGVGIYTFDGASNSLTFYDDGLNETKKNNFVNFNAGELYVTREYVLSMTGGVLSRVTLADNTAEKLCEFEDPATMSSVSPTSLGFVGASGDEVYITGYDNDFALRLYSCNIKTGECTDLGEFDGKLLLCDTFAVNDNYDGESYSVYEYSRPSVLSTLCLEETGEQLLGAGKGKICTSLVCDGKQTLRVYSLAKGMLTAQYEYDCGEADIREVFVVDDDFILFEAKEDSASSIVLWEYSATPAAPSETRNLIAGSASDVCKKKNEELVQSIYEKYKVKILVGDEAVKYYPDYVVVPENNQKIIGEALAKVEKTLAKYPEGFFAELVEKGAHKELNVVLCRKLLPSHTSSLLSAAGYYTELDTQYILLSLSGADIGSTLSHEMMHAVESAMNTHSHSPFGDWGDYNPEGFEYENSYVDENGREFGYDTLGENTPYDVNGMNDIDNIAFFDYYSKTYEKEDRARIFELLMADELSPYFESKTLSAKAAYLCRCLDDFFGCVNEYTDAYWGRIMK